MGINIGNTHFTFPSEMARATRKSQCKQFLDLMKKNASKKTSLSMLCGDYNCNIKETESKLCLDDGYKSSFHDCNERSDAVSHFTHNKQSVFVDHVFYKRNEAQNEHAIRAVDSYLYPRNVATNKWPTKKEYDLSDHRPIVTTFQLQSD